MKAYVNVLIFFLIYYTNVLKRILVPWIWKIYRCSNQSIGDDFSVYPPDRNADPKVRALQGFIAYDLGVNYEGIRYLSRVYGNKGGSFLLPINEKGKLISVKKIKTCN
jgi:hypothetical protein